MTDGRCAYRIFPHYQSYDAPVITFVRFRELEKLATLEWGDFRGQRILYDFDAFLFLTSFGFRPTNVTWPATVHRHGFDWLLCTGKRAHRGSVFRPFGGRRLTTRTAFLTRAASVEASAILGLSTSPGKRCCTESHAWPGRSGT